MQHPPGPVCDRVIGRYALYGEIAAGGMATVHLGRLIGPVGFSRTVAIKRLHPQFAKDPEFAAMFLDEARLAARIQHPNVVATLDVVALEGELFLVMEYVQGESLSRLAKALRNAGARIPPRITASLMAGVYHGLHAAHDARSERGDALGIVHRDVSPQNVIVGIDGVARVLDFGVAKASGRIQTTRDGQVKGKLSYMSPEQIRGAQVDRRTDVYAASVVLWELLVGKRLFDGENEGEVFMKVTEGNIPRPTAYCPDLPPAIDQVLMRGLARDPAHRYPDARSMAIDVEEVLGLASPRQVGEWISGIAGPSLAKRAELVKEIESVSSAGMTLPPAMAPTQAPPDRAWTQPEQPPPPSVPSTVSVVQPVSQVSSISVSRALAAPQRSRSGVPTAILIGALFGGGLMAIVIIAAVHQSKPTPAVPGSAARAPSAAPTLSVAPSPEPSIAPVASVSPASASAAPDPTIAPTSAPVESAHTSAPHSTPPRAGGGTPSPPKASCNPPFTIDSRGIRHLKPECL